MSHTPHTGTVVAQARSVSKSYPGVQALQDVDFTIHRGEVRALLGANGAGKSTLIRALAGVERPDSGEVLLSGVPLRGGVQQASELGVATVYQELSLIPHMSVAENLFLGRWPIVGGRVDLKRMTRDAEGILTKVGLNIDSLQEVASLTLAQQQIIEVMRASSEDPKLLILDEPTSALAAGEVDLVLDVVRNLSSAGVAVIYVSHRMEEIRQIAHTVTIMRDGRHIATEDVRGASTRHIVELMLGEEAREESTGFPPPDLGEVKLKVDRVSLEPKLQDITFELRAGEVLGIAGLLGSGRSELLRAIAGFDQVDSGHIHVKGQDVTNVSAGRIKKLGVGLTPEDRKHEGIIPQMSIADNMLISDYSKVSSSGAIDTKLFAAAASELKERMTVKASDLDLAINTLSGGNQQKAVIGRWLHAGSDILLLDEPTRGVDVSAKAQIYQIIRDLAAQGNAVLFTSSEHEELPQVCDRVIVLKEGQVQEEFHSPHIRTSDLMETLLATSGESRDDV